MIDRDENQFLKDLECAYSKDTIEIIKKEINFNALQKKIFNLLKRFEILENLTKKGKGDFNSYQKNFLVLLTEAYSLIMSLSETLKGIKFNYLLFVENGSEHPLLREYSLEEILNIEGLLKVTNDSKRGIRLVMKKVSTEKLKESGLDFGTEKLRESIVSFYRSLEGLLYSVQKNGNKKKASQKLIKQFKSISGEDRKKVSEKQAVFRKEHKVSSVVAGPQFENAVSSALYHIKELQGLSGVSLQRRLISFYSTDSAIFYSRGDISLKNVANEVERELQLKNLSSGMAQVVKLDTLKKTLVTISYYIIKAQKEMIEPKKLISELLKKEDKISTIWSESQEKTVKETLNQYFKDYFK